jgi:hypothetical protein
MSSSDVQGSYYIKVKNRYVKEAIQHTLVNSLGSIFIFAVGFALSIPSIIFNILVWGRWNIFGYIMSFYPFISAFLIGFSMGRFAKAKTIGVSLAVVLPISLVLLEAVYFRAAFLKIIMHPVPPFEIKFNPIILFPALVLISMVGHRIGSKPVVPT